MDFNDNRYYENREISWLEFNLRILGEARDRENLLFERLKFLSITASNLDEFFMVRIASLKKMAEAGYEKEDISGLKPWEQLKKITEKTQEFVKLQYSTYNRSLVPLLAENGLKIIHGHELLDNSQQEFVDKYFREEVYPVLTPMAVDSSRPFPLIRNKSLNIGALISKKEGNGSVEFATVQVPSVLPRIIRVPSKEGVSIILLEEIIERNIANLFLNYDVISASPYRVMRNSDFEIDEEDTADLLEEIKRQIKKRQWGAAIKLEVHDKIDKRLLKILKKNLEIDDSECYYINGPLDMTFLMKVYALDGFEHLKVEKYYPQPVPGLETTENLFDQIRKKDYLLFHPYQSFEPVIRFVSQAADDPKVLAIKQTLYRVSGNSPIIAALARAAENGKQVTVLVELKARFDEENNINWAQTLEKAGCHVIYGLVGLKTHSKITLVVRREDDGIRRYVHLGTGNYNDATAKLYTDIGLLTCSDAIGEDATAVFNMISGYSEPLVWNKLTLAPLWLRKRFLQLIAREAENAQEGKQAHIIAKMNSLCDKEIIAALYEASSKGVKIELIVRGICCLIPGIEGVSENITVRSIVGNFLEHCRIYYFENDGRQEIYCSSADWMPRNLDRRVEILFPVEDKPLKEQLRHILDVQLADNKKSQMKKTDCTYVRISHRGREVVHSQEQFCREAVAYANAAEKEHEQTRTFKMRMKPKGN
jgi:polyphosphate kinase